jgi:acyl-CoA thioester hydrolase
MVQTFTHRIDVRFRDCDPMGHANHAVYFTYMEQARFAFWNDLRGQLGPGGTSIILARAECDYRAQARFGDALEIRIRVSAVGRSSFALDYETVMADTGRPIATGRTVQVTYDYAAQRTVPIPDGVRQLLEAARGGREDS